MRRILNQAANVPVKHKGSVFQILYRRYVPRMAHSRDDIPLRNLKRYVKYYA